MRRRCLRRSLLPRLAFVAQAALPGACSLRSLDDLEARGTDPGASLEAALSPDAGACVHDSECAAGRCREEVGRCEPCPDDMHLARFVNGESFCIEAHEVSRADYDVFLQALERGDAASPITLAEPPMCEAKARFVPGDGADCQAEFRADREPSLPITCVDLCDAMAYCGWRGRRLCGGPGGVKIGPRRVDTPADEWLTACSGGGTRAFSYGDAYEPRCNIGSSALVPVDALAECSTPDGIAQLNGNAAEWTLICRRPGGVEECLARGGEFRTLDLNVAGCYLPQRGVETAVPPMVYQPLERSPGVGIRCCAD